MPKQVVLLYDSIHEDGKRILEKSFPVIELAGDPAQLMAAIDGASAMIVRTGKIPAEAYSAGRTLKVIGKHGTGLDNVAIPKATENGILVLNTPEANVISVAEHTVTLMLAVSKRLVSADKALQDGVFSGKQGDLTHMAGAYGLMGMELYGKRLGLVGLGRIGREVALRCKGLGMRVSGYDPWVKLEQVADFGVEDIVESVAELATKSDVLSVHVPLIDVYRNLIDAKILASMPQNSILLNCARGGIVDEKALSDAVRSGHLQGAGVDVFTQEPPSSDCPMMGVKNIILTPHRAGGTKESVRRMAVTVAEEVSLVLNGQKSRYLINPEVWGMR